MLIIVFFTVLNGLLRFVEKKGNNGMVLNSPWERSLAFSKSSLHQAMFCRYLLHAHYNWTYRICIRNIRVGSRWNQQVQERIWRHETFQVEIWKEVHLINVNFCTRYDLVWKEDIDGFFPTKSMKRYIVSKSSKYEKKETPFWGI